MARFYAEIKGNRGTASRMGTPKSGLRSHIRGWDVGVRVVIWAAGDSDIVEIHQTSGSNGGPEKLLARIEGDGRTVFYPDSEGIGA